MGIPNINIGQVALDPYNKVLYYKNLDGNLIRSTLDWLQDESYGDINTGDDVYIDGDLQVTGNAAINQDVTIGKGLVITEDLSVGQDLTVTGNFIVNGTTTTINTENVTIEDNILILNSNATGDPTVNAGIEVERGSATNVTIRWNESSDYWEFTNDGTTYQKMVVNINDINDVVISDPQNGDFLKYNGTNWVNDPINLATDTVGDYVLHLVAGTGVFLDNNSGESSTPTISIGQPVETSDDVTFNTVTADLIGDVTGNVTGRVSDISDHPLNELSDVVINNPQNGDFLRYNNAGNWINDPVNLATDTVGDYVSTVTEGTGISVTNTGGEGATPNIALDAVLDNLNDVVITSAANGQLLEFNGTNWVNAVRPSSEPIGHENKADSVISFNESTREFTIAPLTGLTYTVWCVGKRYVKSSPETIEIPDTSGLYYIYFNSSGVLSYKTTYFTWDQDTPTAYIYWNETDNKAYFFADERHGITLDWATHEYLHRTRGAAIADGFGANNYTISGNGSSNEQAKIDIADGTFFDEDLQVDITHSSSPGANTWEQRLQGGAYIPVFYRLNNHWKKDVATQFPLKQGTSRPQYNYESGGTWTTTDVANNHFGISWIIATNNLNEPIIAVLGQGSYGDKGSAEADFYGSLNLDGFPIVEFRPLYKIIYQCSDSFGNTPHAVFKTVQDLRSIISSDQAIATTPVSDHGSMTGLQDDDHVQYFNEERHDLDDHNVLIASLDTDQIQEGVTNLYFTDQRAFDAIQGATPTFNNVTTTSLFLDGIEIYPDGVTDTQVLKYNSGINKFVAGNATVIAAIDDLTDVVITSVTPNQVLKWNGENWINAEPPSASAGNNYKETIGDNSSTTIVITHNLGTRDVVVNLNSTVSPYETWITDWEATTINSITLYFATAPATNSLRVTIVS